MGDFELACNDIACNLYFLLEKLEDFSMFYPNLVLPAEIHKHIS